MGRFEGQALALFGQQSLQLGQGGAGAHRDHQLGGLVADDAVQRPRVQPRAIGTAQKVFAAAAAQAQRRAIRACRVDLIAHGAQSVFHMGHGAHGTGWHQPQT